MRRSRGPVRSGESRIARPHVPRARTDARECGDVQRRRRIANCIGWHECRGTGETGVWFGRSLRTSPHSSRCARPVAPPRHLRRAPDGQRSPAFLARRCCETSIRDFVARVTEEGGPDFAPGADRRVRQRWHALVREADADPDRIAAEQDRRAGGQGSVLARKAALEGGRREGPQAARGRHRQAL